MNTEKNCDEGCWKERYKDGISCWILKEEW